MTSRERYDEPFAILTATQIKIKIKKVKRKTLTLDNLLPFYRVKLELFARDESGNDLNSAEVIDMIKSGKMEELEQNGFKIERASASEYHYSVRPELGEQGEDFGCHNKIYLFSPPLCSVDDDYSPLRFP